MDFLSVQVIKAEIGSVTGLSDSALHIYVGIIVLLTTAAVLRKPLWSFVPWLMVLVVAIIGELVDMPGDFIRLGYWRWEESLRDVRNSMFWPTVILVFIRSGIFLSAKYLSGKQARAPFCLIRERRIEEDNHNYFFCLIWERRKWEESHNYF